MSRKSKIDPVEKVKIVERLLADEVGVREAAQSIGVAPASIRDWRHLYLSEGPTALSDQKKDRSYSKDKVKSCQRISCRTNFFV
ncbi:helix-turn-helix domain-containing protein [Pseudoramibacter alactolyticus]|uniref:helix-turn-helix domain-containing protein n=1 Tax=Pseudoramibacter alactolyticus TaxID=113287 RepID=UPI003D7FB6E1